MKKLIFALFFLVLVASVSARDLRISLVDYQPRPVVPGSFFTATFKVVNSAQANAENITFRLREGSDFSVQGDDELFFSSIKPGEEVSFSYSLKVLSNVLSGFSTLGLRTDYSKESFTDSFSVQVKGIEATLTIDSVKSSPELISPGENAVIDIFITNNAAFSLRNVRVKLDFSSKEIPFAPFEGVGENAVSLIEGNGKSKLSFKIISQSSAVPNIYKIPVVIDYYDEFGQHYSSSNVLSLRVGTIPRLEISAEKNLLVEEKKGVVSLKVVNTGLTPVKFLTINLQPSKDYVLLSSSNIYMGDIDSDDFQTYEIELIPYSNILLIPAVINFKDAGNKNYNLNTLIQLNVFSEDEAINAGLLSRSYSELWIALVVVIIVLFLFFRMLKRKKS